MYFFYQKIADTNYENVVVSKEDMSPTEDPTQHIIDIYVIKDDNKIIKYSNYKCFTELMYFPSNPYKRISEEEFQVWYFLNS